MLRAQLIDARRSASTDLSGVAPTSRRSTGRPCELRDGSEVLRGSASFATGVATAVAGFGGRKLNLNGAVAFASVQVEGGLNMGKDALRGRRHPRRLPRCARRSPNDADAHAGEHGPIPATWAGS
jgi:hypothetical protein